ncbi:glutathione S-transferase [Hyaloraphidium curvatum]|nr:glutathione S-transferase [Hyaloraphidium curvatum]
MPPTLYGVFRSRASRPLWLLLESSAPFEHVPVIQSYRLPGAAIPGALSTDSPEYLAVNPQGQIPALKDGSLVLTESLGIVLHLARRYGGALGPKDGDEQSLMEMWALWAATSVEDPALAIMTAPAGAEGDKLREAAAAKLRRPLKRLEGHLAGREWMLDRFTAADIAVEECVRYAQGHPTLLGEFPAVKAWVDRCQARPAWKKMWEGRMAEPA